MELFSHMNVSQWKLDEVCFMEKLQAQSSDDLSKLAERPLPLGRELLKIANAIHNKYPKQLKGKL